MGPTSLRLSGLPGLPGSLFPSPDWGSFPYLFIQVFNFLLLLFSFWHPYNSDTGTFQVVPEVCKSLFTFLNSCFFILFWLDVYVSLLFQIIALSPGFLPIIVESLNILLYFILGTFHLFFHFSTKLNQICEHFDYQGFKFHQIGWLSPHRLVLFLRFCSVLSFGPYFSVSKQLIGYKGAGP